MNWWDYSRTSAANSLAGSGMQLLGWLPGGQCPMLPDRTHIGSVWYSGPPGDVRLSGGFPPETPIEVHICRHEAAS